MRSKNRFRHGTSSSRNLLRIGFALLLIPAPPPVLGCLTGSVFADGLETNTAAPPHPSWEVSLASATRSSGDTKPSSVTWACWETAPPIPVPSAIEEVACTCIKHGGSGMDKLPLTLVESFSPTVDQTPCLNWRKRQVSLRQLEFRARVHLARPGTHTAEFGSANTQLELRLTPPPPGLDSDVAHTKPLEAPPRLQVPRELTRWRFEENGGDGFKTWLSRSHALDFNPAWLSFGMFDSMDLNTSDRPPGPGVAEPQLWRSTFTVGMGTDWQVSRALTLQAGYRFYDNPIPDGITAGAFPNANHHVTAMAMSLQEGGHSLALIYGLDFLDPASSSGISSARQGNDIASLAHLVSVAYNYSF